MSAATLTPGDSPARLAPFSPDGGLGPRQRRGLCATVVLLHALGAWALLLQQPAVRAALPDMAPLLVNLLSEPARAAAAPALPVPPPATAARPETATPVAPTAATTLPAPALASAAPSPAAPPDPAAASPAQPPAATAAAPVALAGPAVPAAQPPSPPPPPPPARRRQPLSAAAVGYLVPPPAELPLASRRAVESGVVWLRVLVDVHGLPLRIQIQRSSGHPRLDAQALEAMRQARFRPHTVDGLALEVEVIAPIEYLTDQAPT